MAIILASCDGVNIPSQYPFAWFSNWLKFFPCFFLVVQYLLQGVLLIYSGSVLVKTSKLEKYVIQEVIQTLMFAFKQVEGQMVAVDEPMVTVIDILQVTVVILVVVDQFIDVSRPT
ncbi:MAG: hypothetical protein EZS28_042796, partial [Streblomastix strix]